MRGCDSRCCLRFARLLFNADVFHSFQLALSFSGVPFSRLVQVHMAQGKFPMEKMAEEKSQHFLVEGMMMSGC